MKEKVLFFCLSRGHGGLETYLERLLTAFTSRGCQCFGIAWQDSYIARSLLKQQISHFTTNSTYNAFLSIPHWLKWIDQQNITVIHCHKSSDLRFAAIIKVLRPHLRLFYTDHVAPKRAKKDYYHRWVYHRVDRVFAISNYAKSQLEQVLPIPAERITRLYHGIEPSHYQSSYIRPFDRTSLLMEISVPVNRIVIGLPGRVSPGKGHEVWLNALAKLAQMTTIPFIGLIIGGMRTTDGGDEKYTQQLTTLVRQLKLADKVCFTGYRTDLQRILTVCDIVCIPSKMEAFGLTAVESMACGLPIISANTGALPEIVTDDCGLLAQADNPMDWAQQLLKLINQPELRQKMAISAQQRVILQFSQQNHIQRLLSWYQQV